MNLFSLKPLRLMIVFQFSGIRGYPLKVNVKCGGRIHALNTATHFTETFVKRI